MHSVAPGRASVSTGLIDSVQTVAREEGPSDFPTIWGQSEICFHEVELKIPCETLIGLHNVQRNSRDVIL